MKTWLGLIVMAAASTLTLGCDGEYQKQLELAKKAKCALDAASARVAKDPNDMDAKEEVARQTRALDNHAELSGDKPKLMSEVGTHSCP